MKFRLVENLLLESKSDIQRFINKFGQDRYNLYQKIKNKIPTNKEFISSINGQVIMNPKDITEIVKYADEKVVDEIIDFYANAKSSIERRQNAKSGAKLVYNKDGNRIYYVTTPEAMQYYGRHTTWCIAGTYPGEEDKQIKWWNKHLSETDGGYYVLITSDDKKYCILVHDYAVQSFRDAEDNDILNVIKYAHKQFDDSVYEFFGIEIPKDYSKEVYYWDGKREIPQGAVNVVINDGVTKISNYAFYNYAALESITIPDSVTEICYNAFYGCASLLSITIPDSVTEIGENAFNGCISLPSIEIPDSVTEIGECAFSNCRSLKFIKLSSSITEIYKETFYNCTSLQSITIPSNVDQIGVHAFSQCRSLQSIIITEGVAEICWHAFYSCTSLQSITIPDSIYYIDDLAFDKCISLKSVTIPEKFRKNLKDIGIDSTRTKVEFY